MSIHREPCLVLQIKALQARFLASRLVILFGNGRPPFINQAWRSLKERGLRNKAFWPRIHPPSNIVVCGIRQKTLTSAPCLSNTVAILLLHAFGGGSARS